MKVHEVASSSLEYVKVPVRAVESGLTIDPTEATVTMAFVAIGTEPASGDFKTASWETTEGTPDKYAAKCLVGPSGAATPTEGTYEIWVRIQDNPEDVRRKAAGYLKVT